MACPRPPFLMRKLSARPRWRVRATPFLNGQDNDNRAPGNPNRLCREQGWSSSKDELSQKLATSSKILSMGLGSFSQRVNAKVDFGCEKIRGSLQEIRRIPAKLPAELEGDVTGGIRGGITGGIWQSKSGRETYWRILKAP
ncbi:hypothetical protein PIB30_065013, partial [Stylosanthes scabra]|nr:hypothetical protein [Stylosanthes scabra]